MKKVGNNGMPTEINEYFQMLARIRAEEKSKNPSSKDEPMVDPIICGGVADIQVQQKTNETTKPVHNLQAMKKAVKMAGIEGEWIDDSREM